ncbi:MAG: ATP-binding protein, partial [Treponema sp.]|nr:ATP-binding protein [Treponema sp.]
DHLEKIVEHSKETGFNDDFFKKSRQSLEAAASVLKLTQTQTALFAHFFNQCDDENIRMSEIAESLKCSKIRLVKYMDDFDVLENRKLIKCRRNVNERRNREEMPSYRVPMEVIQSIRKGISYTPQDNKNLSIERFFDILGELFEQRTEGELTYESLVNETRDLINDNMQLEFCRKIKEYHLDEYCAVLFLRFCDLYVNNDDDRVGMHDLEDVYESRHHFHQIERLLKSGESELTEDFGLIENVNDDGLGDPEYFHLTNKAKDEFLSELNLNRKKAGNKNMVKAKSIAPKNLIYNNRESRQIKELTSLLQEENFSSVQKRLSENGMRKGFACLFYGPPGTGKTETVYQIAKTTGRDIMAVDISETKSKWFGESEKCVKQVFERYRGAVKTSDIAPILLFNEADAVIGKRMEFGANARAVDQTENAMQNIILQEMENLDGILIATTNLTKNMDRAFERRFLYKIEFSRPGTEIRAALWQSILPSLSTAGARTLASLYDFSGGQIENIARKCTVDKIISGGDISIGKLKLLCDEELFEKDSAKQIGFVRG